MSARPGEKTAIGGIPIIPTGCEYCGRRMNFPCNNANSMVAVGAGDPVCDFQLKSRIAKWTLASAGGHIEKRA